MHNLWALEPNLTKRGYEGSQDIVVMPVVLVILQNSSSFPRSGRPKSAEYEFLLQQYLFAIIT